MRPVPVGESAAVEVVVTPEMTVHFDELGPVHPVYATYSMAKHFEEAGRKLLLRYLDPGEVGVGRRVSVEHLAPAWVGDHLTVTARCADLRGNRLTCDCSAVDASGRELGTGTTVQAVLPEAELASRLRRPAAHDGGDRARRDRSGPGKPPG
jgi:fluoroacetyl-CoA thioesterase